ncbi:glycosyltransferase [Halobacillus trueperi]|uniref:glycosyltransferase n=1 Tax=Halobacillus trueperi TaxID=156205 RepID=UPI0037359075
MKVLHVGEYVKGGVATYLNELLSYQTKDKNVNEVYLALSDKNSEKYFPLLQENTFRYKYSRSTIEIIPAILNINKIIKYTNPDIIHVHSTFAGFYVRLLMLLKKNRPKVVYTPHGWSFIMEIPKWKKKVFSYIERILSNSTDAIVNISMYEKMVADYYKIPCEKSYIIKNGIRKERRLYPLPFQFSKRKINLLFIGRFDKAKGLDILMQFFNDNLMEYIDLYLIGESVLEDTNTKIPKNVVELGWVDNKYIDSYISESDAVIIPSRWEGFGLIVLEAMKNSKAVIVSNRAALPELVDHEETGLIFDLDDMNSLKSLLQSVSKEKLREMGKNGFCEFSRKFTSERMNKEYINLYKEISFGLPNCNKR